MTSNQSEVGCPACGLWFSIPESLASKVIACPSCKQEFQAPPFAPGIPTPETASRSFDEYVDTTRSKVEQIWQQVVSPPITETDAVNWGTIGSVMGVFSGGLLLVGLCFTPFACCSRIDGWHCMCFVLQQQALTKKLDLSAIRLCCFFRLQSSSGYRLA